MSPLDSSSVEPDGVRLSIVYFPEGGIWRRQLSLPSGSSIQDALEISGFFTDFPSKSFENISVGIFGQHLTLQHRLADNDRIEIYSPLRVDPKIARRRRAAHREKVRNIKKKMPVNDLTQS